MLSIVIPFRNDNGPRLAACRFVLAHMRMRFPAESEILLAEQGAFTPMPEGVRHLSVPPHPKGFFSRSMCLNTGVEAARGEAVLIHDADILLDAGYLSGLRAEEGICRVPLAWQYHLDQEASETLYAAEGHPDLLEIRARYPGRRRRFLTSCGVQFLTKRQYQAVEGMNEDIGYGQDHDFFNRLRAHRVVIAHAPHDVFGIHLWHDHGDREWAAEQEKMRSPERIAGRLRLQERRRRDRGGACGRDGGA